MINQFFFFFRYVYVGGADGMIEVFNTGEYGQCCVMSRSNVPYPPSFDVAGLKTLLFR